MKSLSSFFSLGFIFMCQIIISSGSFFRPTVFNRIFPSNKNQKDLSGSNGNDDPSQRIAIPADPYSSEDEINRVVAKKRKSDAESNEASARSAKRYEGRSVRLGDFTSMLPRVNFHFDPVVNFKLKQKITKFGASITLGMDYLSDLKQWRARCDVEDTIVRGRFSLRGSELGWAKTWLWDLGLGMENSAKFKLRLGLNLKTFKAYMRLRFRTEPLSPFDIGDGLTCAGKVGIPGLLHVLGSKPLRLEYLLRIRTPQPEFSARRTERDGLVSLSTGIDKIDVSLDELNFCLEWDEDSPLWDIGLVRDMNRSLRRKPISKPVIVPGSRRSGSMKAPSSPNQSSKSAPSSPSASRSNSNNWPKSRNAFVN